MRLLTAVISGVTIVRKCISYSITTVVLQTPLAPISMLRIETLVSLGEASSRRTISSTWASIFRGQRNYGWHLPFEAAASVIRIWTKQTPLHMRQTQSPSLSLARSLTLGLCRSHASDKAEQALPHCNTNTIKYRLEKHHMPSMVVCTKLMRYTRAVPR